MIGKLRRKFIIAAIISVFLVLGVLIGSINVLNYRSLIAEADRTLEVLTANNGSFPGQMFRGSDRPDTGSPPAWEEMPGEGGTGALFGTRRGGDRELAYQSR